MKLKDQIKVIDSLNEIPDFNAINSTPRGIRLKLVFSDKISSERETVGEQLKLEHPKFLIGIHTTKSEINIIKLISDKEIEEHKYYFERCAKDYRILAIKLINEFADKYHIQIDSEYPMNNLNPYEQFGYKQTGKMNHWDYFFHGTHCAFTNKKTKQYIEVPLIYGLEFGELDPYFFSKFINSTKEYAPRPIEIYDDFWDGSKILEKMIDLGKFEVIQSNWPNQSGIVVTDRKKVEISIFNTEAELNEKRLDKRKPLNKLWYKWKMYWS